MRKLALLLFLFSLYLTCPAIASDERDSAEIGEVNPNDPFVLAETHFYKKEYGLALKGYEKAATSGNPIALNRIGELYRDGLGVSQNYQTAASWFLKAAALKFAPAQLNLGLLYENGLGVERNYGTARGWYLMAIRQNNAEAKFRTGYLIENGLGVEKNTGAAVGWYKQAAEAGNTDAMLALAAMCLNGQEKPNYNGARVWYLRAANLGSAEAARRLGNFYEKGLSVQQDTAAAVKWYKSAAEKGDKEAAERLQTINTLSPKALMDAAAKGDADAMFNLAVLYDDGTGVTADYAKAVDWYLKAARTRADASKVYQLELIQKLYTNDFASLEVTARELRQKREKSQTGNWQLSTFYNVISQPISKNRSKERHWRYLLEKLKQWNQAFPGSVTARIALAQHYTQSPLLPESAIGSENPDNRQAGDRYSEAKQIMSDALTLSERCPQWYAVMMQIAESENWEESRLEALFNEAVKTEPTYLTYYAIEVEHQAEKWRDKDVD